MGYLPVIFPPTSHAIKPFSHFLWFFNFLLFWKAIKIKFLGRWVKKNNSKQINWAIRTTTKKLNYYYNYSKQLIIKPTIIFITIHGNDTKNLLYLKTVKRSHKCTTMVVALYGSFIEMGWINYRNYATQQNQTKSKNKS